MAFRATEGVQHLVSAHPFAFLNVGHTSSPTTTSVGTNKRRSERADVDGHRTRKQRCNEEMPRARAAPEGGLADREALEDVRGGGDGEGGGWGVGVCEGG